MEKKSANFFEAHIEKLILAVVGVGCIVLLIFRTFISPNYVRYDGQKFAPGDIDNHVLKRQADPLNDKLDGDPADDRIYKRRLGDFVGLVDSSINSLDAGAWLPGPGTTSKEVSDKRIYHIPEVVEVNDVSVEHIRAVVYKPTQKIDEENVYSAANSEPNDIDLVTVEARINIAELYERFENNFAGSNVEEVSWRDPCLAEPIIAAAQLQRQQFRADGTWSDWQKVSRTKISPLGKIFEVIEDVADLPAGGMKVRLLQFDNKTVRMDLLQPEAYRIASAKQEWLPPSLHKEYAKYQKEIAEHERREAKEAEKQERQRKRGQLIGRRGTTGETAIVGQKRPTSAKTSGARTALRTRAPAARLPGRGRYESRGSRRRSAKSKTALVDAANKIRDRFDEILITDESDLSRKDEPLWFWTHDDTVEPLKVYRYRIRLGVFNPIAGTNWFSEESKRFQNKAILWSKFSDVTDTVEIPGKLYFFPRDVQKGTKAVTLRICRYKLGYWYSKDFVVRPGEVMGHVADYESDTPETEKNVIVPETIDYTVDAVLVDVVGPVKDWSEGKNMRPRYYYEMLYSFDGVNIERMPIKSWPNELRLKFNEIAKSEKEPKEPLLSWTGSSTRRRTVTTPSFRRSDEYDDGEDDEHRRSEFF